MNKRNLLIWGVVAAILLFFVFGLSNSQQSQPIPGNPAPEITLQFYDGYEWNNLEQATLTNLQGQVVVLNFWASWCVPCQDEAEVLETVWQQYADQGVVFLGVAWSDTDRKAVEFLQTYNISYPNSPDIGLEAQGKYHFRQVPETFVIGRDGTIRYFHAGPMTEPILRDYIEGALQS
jgi:cytochrome c biogenesis protein CcmG/thiol:disulfide interchange protein DsbE